ncbi:Dihydrolipoamide acetyltransferase component of pyruvate dehydrogenase complex [Qipengyuania citrea LAMA 915]|jgi:pyruvate dehydrogenase E2 component (dihydrolipoyllysine-residue acetyltransferase)|uniref:Acetyltransferase component of pyruvate dehydrogenase complex n=1 Tax=Qipengyuania citrea LAMA 915 TaxID=1306953 RepID=A0A0L1KD15_9SPHN|nr:pyruvate dehydrogenase complex dihydrolipoamide acetyltransferase [Qipengyuania citrea]KNH01821.1 Dihydrolipoamide acetyltransferase component of pyruvate dehydrogenase complex [Qipengyuania citrea LAMA 915]
MPTPIKMPALSPTMEEGTLAKWLVKPGDKVEAGDIMAEIETDKATMEFEAVDEGTIASIAVDEGSEGVKVGTVIAMLAEEGEDLDEAAAAAPEGDGEVPEPTSADSGSDKESVVPAKAGTANEAAQQKATPASAGVTNGAKAPAAPKDDSGERIIASPLARRIAEQKGIDLASVTGSGPRGRIVKADVEGAETGKPAAPAKQDATAEMAEPRVPSKTPAESEYGAPYEEEKLTNVRKVIARRLTESKQQVPHYYLAVDVRLDALLDLRKQLNAGLEADGVKLSVNDLLIKALARALMRVPQCNVSFQGDTLHRYTRADVSVAVAAPTGLITPIITEADTKGLAAISKQMKTLAEKARDGKLQPHEYQGGTASLSNLGMFGIKQFDAVINPPQGMIMAVGAGEQRPYVVDGELQVASVMTASGSFDHRAIDGADGAQLMEAFKQLCENPMGLVV